MRVGGIVLCGGQSSRMGRPKAWLPFAGELMLPRVVRLVGEAVSPVVVVAAPEQEVPPLPDEVAIVRDEERGRGPLAGLSAGLKALAGRAEAAYLSSCDVPFLRPAFVRRLVGLLGEHAVCVPRVGDGNDATVTLPIPKPVAPLIPQKSTRGSLPAWTSHRGHGPGSDVRIPLQLPLSSLTRGYDPQIMNNGFVGSCPRRTLPASSNHSGCAAICRSIVCRSRRLRSSGQSM